MSAVRESLLALLLILAFSGKSLLSCIGLEYTSIDEDCFI